MNKEDKINNLLRKLGLVEHEMLVYLYLMEKGTALSVSDIARGLIFFRPIIYKSLGLLEEKGLIGSVIKGKRKLYVAEPPQKIRGILRDLNIDMEETLPDLEEIYKTPNDKPVIKFLDGKKGITFVYQDILDSLKRGEVFYRYSSSTDAIKTRKYLPKDYEKNRDNKNLERYVIRSEATKTQLKPDLNRNTKIVPSDFDLFDQNIIQLIYDSKVAIVDLNSKTSFIIENDKFADFQKKIFKLLYRKL